MYLLSLCITLNTGSCVHSLSLLKQKTCKGKDVVKLMEIFFSVEKHCFIAYCWSKIVVRHPWFVCEQSSQTFSDSCGKRKFKLVICRGLGNSRYNNRALRFYVFADNGSLINIKLHPKLLHKSSDQNFKRSKTQAAHIKLEFSRFNQFHKLNDQQVDKY